jgi:glucokinase
MSNRLALGVDVGATKIAIALVDGNYQVRNRVEVASSATDGFELWGRVASATNDILRKSEATLIGVGIGSAGPIYPNAGTISPVNIPVWRDFPIVECFREVAHVDRVSLHGDAMALAHAEHKVGAGVGSKNMLGIVVSTGVGGGLILNNQLFEGDTGNTSYIGHSSINFQGVECACGRLGCVEAYASGPNMVALAKQNGWVSSSNSFIDVAEAARTGDLAALNAIEVGSKALAVGMVNFVESLDISHIVIGGGVAQAGEIYWNPLMKHIRAEAKYAGFLSDLKVSPAKLSLDAGLIGAALGVL